MSETATRDILVVDDNMLSTQLIVAALTTLGYNCRQAGDGRQALDEVARQRPDLVLLDVEMPVLDGLATLRELRSDPATLSLPVILLTGLDSDADIVRGVGAGATMYLTKPVEIDKLSALLTAMLGRPREG